ncbi:MAG TPA: glutamate--cysteine ligase [Thermoanaerobaculia bacterium]|nr:glutamate--cysteine ligase [Thermoanaerobaculia bacterium]
MGEDIDRTEFSAEHRALFQRRLRENLAALKGLLARPGFGTGPPSIGAEVELYLIGRDSCPLPCNQELLAGAADPRIALELNRFNLEYNLTPVPAAGRPFSSLETELCAALASLNRHAASLGGRVIPIGILPTLRRRDFGPGAMTPLPRYEALTRSLQRLRGEHFAIRIGGPEPVSLEADDVTLEGANTSFQVHLRVEPSAFARTFNALQLVTPLMLAISCNAPLLFGRRLWHETRVPLFKLAVDSRDRDSRALHLPPRVHLGTGWVREGVYELYAAAVHLHEPLLPIPTRENAIARLRTGRVPSLRELRLHQGTIWPWNRPVYDPSDGGHLRIEMRALPAGPSAVDMCASAAFGLGLAVALRERIDDLLPACPFAIAEENFYRAAQHGHEALLFWPGAEGVLERRPAPELALELLPVALRGLVRLGVARAEAARYLEVVRERVERRTSGAAWQLRQLDRLQPRLGRAGALRRLVDGYAEHALANRPVSEWPDIP